MCFFNCPRIIKKLEFYFFMCHIIISSMFCYPYFSSLEIFLCRSRRHWRILAFSSSEIFWYPYVHIFAFCFFLLQKNVDPFDEPYYFSDPVVIFISLEITLIILISSHLNLSCKLYEYFMNYLESLEIT